MVHYDETNAKAFGTKNEKPFGAITVIDVSKDLHFMCTGYENGQIVLWNIDKKTRLNVVEKIHQTSILTLKIYVNKEK